jgi:hypothetical protein
LVTMYGRYAKSKIWYGGMSWREKSFFVDKDRIIKILEKKKP